MLDYGDYFLINGDNSMRDKICLALDVDNITSVRELVHRTRDYIGMYKVGMELFTALGPSAVEEILGYDTKVFLDLKYHDIPTTVKKAAIAATRMNVCMFNIHTLGGSEMIKMTTDAVAEEAVRLGIEKPFVLGVTLLTSTSSQILQRDLLVNESIRDYVKHLAIIGRQCGLDCVVSSPLELKDIKRELGSDFICVTPGIRPEWAVANDQVRFTTPIEAINDGADYIVIGRPIADAGDPAKAAEMILTELNQYFLGK